MKNEEILSRVQEFASYAEDNLAEQMERAEKGMDFYLGKQWDDDIKVELERKGKKALTINHCLPIVNFLSGSQRQNRKDGKALARKGGNEAVARVLTGLTKHTMDLSDGEHSSSECFKDGTSSGIGWLSLDRSMANDPFNGELEITRQSPFDVLYDPDCESYDLNERKKGAKYVILRNWIDLDLLKEAFPKKKTQLANMMTATTAGTDTNTSQFLTEMLYGPDGVRREEGTRKYRLRVYKTYWKMPKARLAVQTPEGQLLYLNQTSKKDKETFSQLVKQHGEENVVYRKTIVDELSSTISVGDVVLNHTEKPFGNSNLFPLIPFSPFFADGRRMGILENLIDPQEEENKNRTQAMHLLNQSSNAGWIVNRVEKTYKKILSMFGSRPDIVLERAKCGGHLERIEPNQLSSGHVTLSERAGENMKEISGVNSANQGQQERAESGILNLQRQRQGMTINEPVFDNFDKTMKILYTTIIDYVRNTDTYSEQEIYKIIDEEDLIDETIMANIKIQLRKDLPAPPQPDPLSLAAMPPEKQEMGTQIIMAKYQEALDIYEKQLTAMARPMAIARTMALVKNWSVGRYGIAINESPTSPTAKFTNAMEIERIQQAYPGSIPPDVYVDVSSLPSNIKDDIKRGLSRQVA